MNRADWNRRYTEAEMLWSAEPNRFLVEEVEDLAPGRALDLACGAGRNAVWLAGRGWQVDAVDFSDVALAKARGLADRRGADVNWIDADVELYTPQSGAYDLVILFYLQIPWKAMKELLPRAAAAVAPGGTFLLVAHDRTNLESGHGGPKSPEVLYTPDEVAAELSALRVVETARRWRPVATDEGEVEAIDCLVRALAP